MPIFEIQGPDGRIYELDAPDEKSALAAFGEIGAQPKPDQGGGFMDTMHSLTQGAANAVTFGLDDEIAAGLGTLGGMLPGGHGKGYSQLVQEIRAENNQKAEAAPVAHAVGQIGAGLAGGVGLARGGMSLATNAAKAGGGLKRVAAGGAVDSVLMGAASGAGNGEGLDGRLGGAAVGGLLGVGLGVAAPFAIAGATGAAKPLVAPLMSRIRPETYANNALATNLRRSGRSVDDIVDMLSGAQADGQGMFTVGDAMGHAGERLLSTISRTPNDSRQMLVETLMGRQMGQGERLSNALAEGFAAPDTAAQRASRLTAERSATANANYGAARGGAQAVDPSKAIAAADDFLRPGAARVMQNETGIADDSIEAAVRRARSYLTDGKSTVSDFDTALRSKQELDAMIEGAKPSVQRQLIPIRNALDDALSEASPDYAGARDTFRRQSRAIDAVDEGTAAASGRVRSSDSIPRFDAMTPDEQSAFRAGYVDPLIARVEASAASPTTNKARGLMTEKTGAEFPAFAAPGQADRLGNRIAREDRMFRTANAALGGSKTADNLADQADLSQFDPTIIRTLVREGPVAAAMATVGRALAEAQGMSPSVVERIARTLMETDPTAARNLLQKGVTRQTRDDAVRGLATMLTTTIGSSAAGRLAAP